MRHLNTDLLDKGFTIKEGSTFLAAAYADDILICTENIENAEFLANKVEELLNQIGIQLNVSKSDAYIINIHERLPTDNVGNCIISHHTPIPVLPNNILSKYLGANLCPEKECDLEDLSQKVGNRLEKLNICDHLQIKQKIQLCDMFIESQLIFPSQIYYDRNILLNNHYASSCKAIKTFYKAVTGLLTPSDAFLYSSKVVGGLGFQNSAWKAHVNGCITAKRLESSLDPRLQAVDSVNEVNYVDVVDMHITKLQTTLSNFTENDKKSIKTILEDDKKLKARRVVDILRAVSLRDWKDSMSGKLAGINLYFENASSHLLFGQNSLNI